MCLLETFGVLMSGPPVPGTRPPRACEQATGGAERVLRSSLPCAINRVNNHSAVLAGPRASPPPATKPHDATISLWLPAPHLTMLQLQQQQLAQHQQLRRPASAQLRAQAVLPRVATSRCSSSSRKAGPPIIMAGLKKETKKLTKTLKAHRKRLESLLAVQQQQPELAAAPQGFSQAQLLAVLAEIAQLQTSLAAVRQQQRALMAAAAAEGGDSSDSDSDCDDDREQLQRQPKQRRMATAAATATGQPMMVLQQQQEQSRQATSSSSSSVVCLQSPLIDQEQPDLCQQLPPPQPYAASGRVLVCQGKACVRKGALQVLQAVSHATAASPGVEVLPCKCLGKCKQGPTMRVRTEGQPRSSLVTEIEALEVPDILDSLLTA